ncbi:MAG: gliding motility-associated C-terminal domain-containing protein [Bacteroidota bacterium]
MMLRPYFEGIKQALFVLLTLLLSLGHAPSFGQVGCFKIKSILVDACGLPEADNEMVRFQVGNAPLNVSSLNVTWSTTSNAFLGICQNATTASVVSAINATITSCGWVREPVGNILPANSQVILGTSTALNPTANSFANLQDTLYMIFQCPGNTSGHFKNYALGAGPRNFTMSFGASCSETVTYVVDSLTDPTGAHVISDGAAVQFDNLHNASYFNDGCNAPIIPLVYTTSISNNSSCAGVPVNVTAQIVSGNYSSFFWSGGSGAFNNVNALTTSYTPASNFQGNEQLYFTIINACHDTIRDTLDLSVLSGGQVSISANGPTTFCTGGNVTLTAQGSGNFLWSNGSVSPSINVSNAGIYTVTLTNTCGSSSSSQTVNVITNPATVIAASGPTTFCEGDSVRLTASGASTYLWSNGATGSTITVTQSGSYTVTGNSSCGNSQANQAVVVNPLPLANITTADSLHFCSGTTFTINASSNSSLQWSNGSTTNSIQITSPGIYSIIATNSCGSVYDTIHTFMDVAPQVTIVSSNGAALCTGDSTYLVAVVNGTGTILWPNGSTNDSLLVKSPGNYQVSVTNNCGTTTSNYSVTTTNNPSVSIQPSGSINLCDGDSVLLVASGSYTNLIWNNGNTNDSIMVHNSPLVIVTATNTCGSDIDSITINNVPKPVISISSVGNLSICLGDTTLLIASGNGGIQWTSGATNDSIYVTTPGIYIATTTNFCGAKSDSVLINPGLIPTVFIEGSDGIICKGETETLSVNCNAPVIWSSGDTTHTLTVSNPGIYYVTATNNCGSASDTLVIDTSNVQAYFVPSVHEGYAPLLVSFSNLSLNAVQSIWTFDQNITNYLWSPSHSFDAPATYYVTLNAIDQYGCSDQYVDTIIVNDIYYFIPNAFTPNNDNKNEVFTIASNDSLVYDASIFNRWGQSIYSWNQNHLGWNGSDKNNKECEEDVYYYVFNLKLSTTTKSIYGKVHLIR